MQLPKVDRLESYDFCLSVSAVRRLWNSCGTGVSGMPLSWNEVADGYAERLGECHDRSSEQRLQTGEVEHYVSGHVQ